MTPVASLVEEATALLARAVQSLDTLDTADALPVLSHLARARKVCEAGETALAARVEAHSLHRGSGHATPADLLAAATGGSRAQALDTLETARRLEAQPELDRAFRSGELSRAQTSVIAEAAEADPSAQAALMETARRETLRTLRDKAREVRLAAEDDRLGRHERQRRARSFRHGIDGEGMVWGSFKLPPETGAALVNAVEARADREYRRAYREGRREPHDRYAADALVALVTGTATARGRGAEVVVLVSRESLLRGRVEGDEVCMVRGAGPVPVEVAREVMDDAFLKGVLVDGTRVEALAHFGRHIPAELRTALEVRATLEAGDVVCSVPGCDRPFVEWDHRDPYASGGATSEDNLDPMCRPHHRDKTAGRLRREGGKWVVVEPGPVAAGRSP